jgi:hypothetical protein
MFDSAAIFLAAGEIVLEVILDFCSTTSSSCGFVKIKGSSELSKTFTSSFSLTTLIGSGFFGGGVYFFSSTGVLLAAFFDWLIVPSKVPTFTV